jgi:hypothetical protein
MPDEPKCQCYVTFESDAKPVVCRDNCRLHGPTLVPSGSLNAAIRAKLASWTLPGLKWMPAMGLGGSARPEDFEAFWKAGPVLGWGAQNPSPVDRMRAALLATLDLHPSELHECPQWDANGEQYTAYDRTCPTQLAIAAELGIEVDRG